MKNIYLTFITIIILAVKSYAQTTVIPAVPTIDNAEKTNIAYHTSAADDSAFSHIHILPNLAVGRITVVVDDANPNVIQQGECVIYNSGGTPVAKSPFTTGTNQLYVSNFSAGMYYIRLVQKNGEAAVRKFIVMK